MHCAERPSFGNKLWHGTNTFFALVFKMSVLAALLSYLLSTVHVHPLCIYIFHNTVSGTSEINLLWSHHSSVTKPELAAGRGSLPLPHLSEADEVTSGFWSNRVNPSWMKLFLVCGRNLNKYWNISCKNEFCVVDTCTSSSNWDELNFKWTLWKPRL